MRKPLIAVVLLAAGLRALPAEAKTFYPMISKTSPCAVPVGQTVECEVMAENGFYSPSAVLVSGQGVTGEIIPQETGEGAKPQYAAGGDTLKVRFQVAGDALPGIRDFRVITARGASTVGQLAIVRAPLVREAAENSSLTTAQVLSLPATVSGAIESKEDVDYYRFPAQAGTSLVFNLVCQRLQHKLGPLAYHVDPMITLRNVSGTVLASSDNFYGGDPLLQYRFAEAGDYFLEVRDVRYAGYRLWEYALEIHDRPIVLQSLPGVIAPAEPASMKLAGFNLPPEAALAALVPSEAPEGIQKLLSPPIQGQTIDPVIPVHVSRLPRVAEVPSANETPETAQAVTLPAGVLGMVDVADDVDCYAFQLKKGERYTFNVVARSIGSPLDAYLRLYDPKGALLLENDDCTDKTGNADCRNEITTPDSRLENWLVPEDGRYVLEIRDTHLRGGERFNYYLEARPIRPWFRMELDTDKSIVAPGVSTTIFVRAFRKEGFSGPIRLNIEGVPAGVTAVCGHIPAGEQDTCIILKGEDNAVPGTFGNIRVTGTGIPDATTPAPAAAETATATPTDPAAAPIPLTAVAVPFQELRRDGGARYMTPVEMHTVSVANVLDLKNVRISPAILSLKPGESQTVEVSFDRSPEFKEAVTLTGMHYQHVWVFGRCLPPGVTVDESASKLRVPGDQNKGTIVLKVAADAKPAEPRLVPLMANVAINFTLKMIYSSDPLTVRVEAKP